MQKKPVGIVEQWRQDFRISRFRRRDKTSMLKHRAMYSLTLGGDQALHIWLLPLLFNVLVILSLDGLIDFWTVTLQFWNDLLNFGATVAMAPLDLGFYELWMPTVVVEGGLPSALVWWSTFLVCAVIFVGTYFIQPNRALPYIYILRALVFLQCTALMFFAFIPASFPHVLENYVDNGLFMGVCLIMLVPWIYALTYYLFDFHILQKILATVLSIVFFVIAVPLQYLLHVNLVAHASLLFMPIIYLAFGVFMDVMAFVAIYSYAMSWRFGRS